MNENKYLASLSSELLARKGDAKPSQLMVDPDHVPVIEWDAAGAQEKGLYGFEGRDVRSRPFNLLRAQILKEIEQKTWRSLGIVSAAPGSGKSFIAANLAAALSRSGDRDVYLLDFDLRRPSVHRLFGISGERGLTEFLSGDTDDLGSIAGKLQGEQLTLLPSFPSDAPSAELLRSDPAKSLFAWLRSLPPTALAICDLPPAFANDDAAIVAENLDSYLLVVEEGRTTKKQVKDAVQALSPAVMAGAVLNRYFGGIFSDDYGYSYLSSPNYGDYYS